MTTLSAASDLQSSQRHYLSVSEIVALRSIPSNAITTSLLRQNDVTTSFLRNDDVIIVSHVRWVVWVVRVVTGAKIVALHDCQ